VIAYTAALLSAALLSRGSDPCWKPDATHTGAGKLDAITFSQQIAQVLVIAPCIGRAGQFDHLALHLLTDTLYRLSASFPMGQRESRPPFDTLHTIVSHARSDRLSSTAAEAAVSCPTKSRGSTITRFCSWVFKVSVSFIHGHFRLHTSTLLSRLISIFTLVKRFGNIKDDTELSPQLLALCAKVQRRSVTQQ
jgi:hypothetical protein